MTESDSEPPGAPEPEPHWDLLPHDPLGFFGLAEGFDQKDLKRSYNRLIRRYKPEKAPEEFQQIRAAYERLDNQLRYGTQTDHDREAFETSSRAWSAAAADRPGENRGAADGSASTRSKPAEKPLAERLRSESPRAVYQELAAKKAKSPYDYFALATLADLCEPNKPLRYPQWLLAGLREHHHDHGLYNLLQSYLAAAHADASLVELLVAVSEATGDDRFYPLTEAAWETLLRSVNEGQHAPGLFVQTLERCAANLRGAAEGNKIAFGIRVARSALWSRDPATADWALKTLDSIEANFASAPPWLEYDFELLMVVVQYLHQRDSFVAGDALRQSLDAALETFFTTPFPVCDHAVVERQLALLADPDRLMAAFPLKEGDDPSRAFFALWNWVGNEVAQRQGAEEMEEPESRRWVNPLREMLSRCESKMGATSRGVIWNFSNLIFWAVHIAVWTISIAMSIAIAVTIAEKYRQHVNDVLVIIGALTLSAVGSLYISLKFISPRWEPYHRKTAQHFYKLYWRREALDFFTRSRMGYWLMRDILQRLAPQSFSTSQWVASWVNQDYALAMHAQACRFEV
ncbi:DnaJ domain protein [Pseudobythopirellula maris]|uniref:DnaJ domain protein n=1 Tax=Pseudobythopirellula maris TaxID=2527991 RepID=A0A5C5ZSC0_9BACT|nr:J domain-containing protein [Pseudobythopirellula maris]TWT89103.1 DnaJ domain protein [Pseudobythopirellula maris]